MKRTALASSAALDGTPATRNRAGPCDSKGVMEYSTLSSFIRAAVTDARGINREFYSPNARFWHTATNNKDRQNGCLVCFAGAVLANMIPATITIHDINGLLDLDMPRPAINRLVALDFVRCGDLVGAIGHMNFTEPFTPSQKAQLVGLQQQLDGHRNAIWHTQFVGWRDFDEFLVSMEVIANQLEAIRL